MMNTLSIRYKLLYAVLMHWLVFAAISIVSMAVANLFQKLAMKEKESDPVVSAILFQFLLTIFTGIFAFLRGFQIPKAEVLFPYVILSSLFYAIGVQLFFKAIKIIEASEMTILTGFGAVATIGAAFLFLGERLTILQFIGVLAILLSVVIVEYEGKRFVMNKGVWYSLIGTSLFGFAVTMDAFILRSYDAVSYTPIICLLPGLFLCFMFPKKVVVLLSTFRGALNRNLLIYGFVYSIQALAYFLALESGALASQLNALFKAEIVLTVILASIWLKETKRLPQKILAAVVATGGVLLLA